MQKSQLQTSKTLSFIGAILAIVLGALYCLTIVGIIVGIPMIVGGIILLKFRDYSDDMFYAHRGALLGWGIFFLFCTMIGGILELIAYFQANSYAATAADVNQQSSMDFSSVERAYDLKEKGVISDSEFDDIKAAALRHEGVDATSEATSTNTASDADTQKDTTTEDSAADNAAVASATDQQSGAADSTSATDAPTSAADDAPKD